jgi:hypothetical protein
MALIVQDNNGSVPGANGYISVAEFKAYHDDRAQAYTGFNDAAIEAAIIRATDYLDQRFRFVGKRRQGRSQTTEWPRSDAWDRDERDVNDVPPEVKEATAEYALRALAATLNPDPERNASGVAIQSKSEAVGPISESVTFVSGAIFTMPKYPAADQRLFSSGLVRTGGTVLRG